MSAAASDTRVVCLRFEIDDQQTWAQWLDAAGARHGIAELRAHPDAVDPTTVDVFFTATGEAEARALAAALIDDATTSRSGALDVRFIAAPRTLL